MHHRGKFEIDDTGSILPSDKNVNELRLLFLDRKYIHDELLGPGDPGDFDLGSWHILCHLTAGCAVFKKADIFLWVEISHVPIIDQYTATVTIYSENESVTTFPLLSQQGKSLMKKATLLGFVEGSSFGHISGRSIHDNSKDFNNNLRQEYDHEPTSTKEGGRVWEHWVVTRNLNSNVCISLLQAYLDILSVCGGLYVGIIGRGRVDYYHPEQLRALVDVGLLLINEALLYITPKPIPSEIALSIYSANPVICVKAIKHLDWTSNSISYFMFPRKIANWNSKNNFIKNIQII